MPCAAVLGLPIEHSLSPRLHHAAYAALGLSEWHYGRVELGEPQLAGWLASRGPQWLGLSCTMPLKRAALALADSASAVAQTVGAANTLLRRGAGWRADNTDVDGVLGALDALAARPGPGTSVLVLGAGGTAQAVVVALSRCGVGSVDVAVRSPDRAATLFQTAARAGVAVRLRELPGRMNAELVISTLPPGAAIAAESWGGVGGLFDVVYAPWPTPLAAAAGAAGVPVVGGAEMLLHQAARQVELMTGRPAPLQAMRAALPAPDSPGPEQGGR